MRALSLLTLSCLPAAEAFAQATPATYPPFSAAAAVSSYWAPALVGGIGVLSVCSAAVAIVWLVSRHRRERAAQLHNTAVELAQRGLPLPPQLLPSASRMYADLRTGLVLAGLGIGAIVFALTLPVHPAWGLGLIPLFAGLGYILTWLLGRQQSRSDP